MCNYVSYCMPVTHMLINADVCLIMLIYNRTVAKKKVGAIKRHDVSVTLPCHF